MPGALDHLPLSAAVLFDLDGTLVDTVEVRIAAWERALDEAHLPSGRAALAPLIGLDGRRLAREIGILAGDPIGDRRAEAIDRRSGEIYARLNVATRPLPGVGRLIAELDRRAIRWAIATSSRAAQVATSVTALGLPVTPVIVDASHVMRAKPEPDLLLLAARVLEVEPSACWYVGDSTWDMLSAVAAGMVGIGVTAGSAVDAAALADAGSTAVFDTLDDLATAIKAR